MVTRQDYLEKFEKALLSMDQLAAKDILSKIANHENGGDVAGNIEEFIVPVLEKIGANWEKEDVTLSQVYMAGRICETLLEEIRPPTAQSVAQKVKVAVVTLEDYHLLGKRMVKSVLLSGGFDPVDYGSQTAAGLAGLVKRDGVEILLISTLMLPSALRIKELRKMLSDSGCSVKIVVGGAPFRFDGNLWKEVGADATGARASDSVRLVREMMEGDF